MSHRFRFKALRQYREFLLKREQIALAQALQRLEAGEVKRAQARERLKAESIHFEKRQCEGMGVPDFLAYGDRIQALEQHLLRLEREVLELRSEVESARRDVLTRERDLRALTILEERERESYIRDMRKKEQGCIDEFAILGTSRRKDHSVSS